jgi:hypothetical protein
VTMTPTVEEMTRRLDELGVVVPPAATPTEIHQLLIRTLSERLNSSIAGDSEHEVEIIEEEPSTALLPRTDTRPQIPTASIWAHLAAMAEPLARSNLVKPALRGKPNDVLMILLTGYDLQITMTQALAKVHVIEGQPAASPELILGLIRRDGHRAWPGGHDGTGIEQDSDDVRTLRAVVHAVRKDDPERVISAHYTIANAEQAGLVKVVDNRLNARSSQGNRPLPWEQYPEDLLWARAVSRLGRRNFSDVLLGLSYVPEELGAIDVNSYDVPATPPLAPLGPDPQTIEMQPAMREDLRRRIDALPQSVRDELAERWKSLVKSKALRSLDRLLDREYDAADDLVRNYERIAERATETPATPCDEDQESLDLQRETGLPFACEDFGQEAPRTCPTPEQCRSAGECLLSPI